MYGFSFSLLSLPPSFRFHIKGERLPPFLLMRRKLASPGGGLSPSFRLHNSLLEKANVFLFRRRAESMHSASTKGNAFTYEKGKSRGPLLYLVLYKFRADPT